ncbi:MAG TPA: ankyrin repeat domain-containing protein [Pyrinomonadaceae bacterium]|nr:ankyrin repeat domain-containing protein [Pyrinomonadaceae bacterium]
MKVRLPPELVLTVLVLLCATACAEQPPTNPTPESYQRFLKLRGYEFNEKAFLAAVAVNDSTAVDGFISAGVNPNAKDAETGASALILAATKDELEVVQVLLHGGADVNLKDNFGYTATLRALQYDHDEIAELLVEQPGLDVNAQAQRAPTVLMSYAWRGREDLVKKLLSLGANPNLTDPGGDTALHGAAQVGSVPMTTMLLKAGANPNAKNKVGGTPLMWAGVYGRADVARALLDGGAKAELKDEDGVTAAVWAARNNWSAVAQLLRAAEKH